MRVPLCVCVFVCMFACLGMLCEAVGHWAALPRSHHISSRQPKRYLSAKSSKNNLVTFVFAGVGVYVYMCHLMCLFVWIDWLKGLTTHTCTHIFVYRHTHADVNNSRVKNVAKRQSDNAHTRTRKSKQSNVRVCMWICVCNWSHKAAVKDETATA